MANENWIPPYINEATYEEPTNEDKGTTRLEVLREIKIGAGDKSIRGTLDGFWVGADNFGDADFSVDMSGKVTARELWLTTSGKLYIASNNYLTWQGAPLNYWDFFKGSVHTWGDYYADGNIVADYENDGTGGFQVGLDAGITHTEVINGKTFTWKKGILISVI